ncbi:MAG: monomeric [FeFe] hydrogenase [Acidaminococcaceae bacterium]|nr:monomeric [FeFe] hydrogenase [Acidaminococcaceae bacterium]
MEVTEITKLRREVLTRLARYTYEGSLVDRVYEILYQVVTEDTPRYRCCVHKERAVLKNRICMALGLPTGINIIEASKIALKEPVDKDLPIIDVLPEACTQCPVEKYMVTDVCRHCLTHKCMNSCPKGAIAVYQKRAYIDHAKCIECGKCKQACPYGAIIEITRPCERACALGAIHPGADKKASMDKKICVECGACRSACPFGAIDERSCIVQLIQKIKSGAKVYALLAPSFVTQFGLKTKPGQIVAAFKALGFAAVKEVAVGADMTVLYEAKEYLDKVPTEINFMTNSCCPAFVGLVEKHAANLVNHISTTASPMVACGKKIKAEDKDAVTVFVGPCITKKIEARKYPEAIDYVLTFEEALCMLQGIGIAPASLPEEEFHTEASACGSSFPLRAGVGSAVAEAVHKMSGADVKAYYTCGLVNCVEGLKAIEEGKLDATYFEGMSCDKGCINGPGALAEPGITNVFLKKFVDAAPIKDSADNEEAQKGVAEVDMER